MENNELEKENVIKKGKTWKRKSLRKPEKKNKKVGNKEGKE